MLARAVATGELLDDPGLLRNALVDRRQCARLHPIHQTRRLAHSRQRICGKGRCPHQAHQHHLSQNTSFHRQRLSMLGETELVEPDCAFLRGSIFKRDPAPEKCGIAPLLRPNNVRLWHKADVTSWRRDVRFWEAADSVFYED